MRRPGPGSNLIRQSFSERRETTSLAHSYALKGIPDKRSMVPIRSSYFL
jgi:hypothetical protein